MNIKSATYVISSPSVEQCPSPEKREYAFIGRSNVGKSSLINMLTNHKNLAKTSGRPGKTQLINHFKINKRLIQHTFKRLLNFFFLIEKRNNYRKYGFHDYCIILMSKDNLSDRYQNKLILDLYSIYFSLKRELQF